MSKVFLLGVLVGVAHVACSSGGGTSAETEPDDADDPAEDAGDGLHHPGTDDGVHIDEAVACDALTAARDAKLAALGQCTPFTIRECPQFLSVQFSPPCMEFDEGSVKGCAAYYEAQTSCAELAAAVEDCAITPFEGSEPAGCPAE